MGNELVVGIALTGAETKALRHGHGQLTGAYVSAKDGELWLINALISGDNAAPIEADDQTRSRKLLAKKREIDALATAKQQGKTIVPLDILTRGRFIKVRIAIGRGKKKYDKRESIKRRDHDRSTQAELRKQR